MAVAYEWSQPRADSREILIGMPSMAMAELRPSQNSIIDASPKSIEELPPPGTRRWVIRRKAEVVAGVRAGLISIEEACKRYSLSVEEFLSWQRAIDRHGLRGLRTTRIQDYRTIDRVEPEDESPHS
ncbi:MAG: DUF1153 domain-containing protein [Rhodospirillaceae bacterium]|nr:DUF1153 domain-containing protein [Rhodospirillaceae bacterium]